MIVDEIDIERISVVEPENDPPVRPNGDRMEIFQITLQSMRAEARNFHGFKCIGRVEKE